MTKTELKENITKINKLLRSDNYEAGIELIKTLDDPEISKGTARTLSTIIKKFLKQRDYESIDMGIELARGLDEPAVFETLLDGCAISGNGKLVRNAAFTGSGPAQPYLDYALWNLILLSPGFPKIDESLKHSNITVLDLSCPGYNHRYFQNVEILTNCKNITSLNLRLCGSLQNVDGLANCTKLTNLNLRSCGSLQNVDALSKLTKLTSLDLGSCGSLQNVDGLASCTKLTSLNLRYCGSLQNVDGLANFMNLTSLDLGYSDFTTIPGGLDLIPNLTNLNLYECGLIQNLDNLNNCTKLTTLNLSRYTYYSDDKKDVLQNINGLKNLTCLTSLELANRDSLQTVDALENLTNLTSLDLSYCDSLQDVDGLTNLINLTSLDLSNCDSLQVQYMTSEMTTREQVSAYQDKIRIVMALKKNDINTLLDYKDATVLDLRGCDSLQNVDGLANLPNLTSLDLSNCSTLTNADGLAHLDNLVSLDMSGCTSLQNAAGLANLTKLTSLDLSQCDCLQVLPIKSIMTAAEVTEYQNRMCVLNAILDGDTTRFSDYTEIRTLDLSEHPSLLNADGLANLPNLTSLDLSGCTALQNVDGLAGCAKITTLGLSNCSTLTNADGLVHLDNLISLDMSKCASIKPKPSPVSMSSRGQVSSYQITIMKKAGIKIPKSYIDSSSAAKKESAGHKDIKSMVVKIKKFLKQRDYDNIDMGITLARSMAEPQIFEDLLVGCNIDKDGNLVRNKTFTGSGPAQPYLDYALWNLIGYAPDDASLDESIQKTKVIKVCINPTNWYDIDRLPQGLCEMVNLNTLDLRGNPLTALPPEIGQLKNLEILNLQGNNIEKLPPEIGQLKNLEILNLQGNNIEKLPPEIGLLTKLKLLDLGEGTGRGDSNQLTSLPSEIFQLKGAKINLNNSFKYGNYIDNWFKTLKPGQCSILLNSFTRLPDRIRKLAMLYSDDNVIDDSLKKENITSLSFKYLDLESLPEKIGQLKNLESLDLRNNKLTVLPAEIGQLNKLKSLDLSNNEFTHLLQELEQLKNLDSLKISSNELAEFPKEILQLDNLKTLDLSLNPLSEIPSGISKLKKLKTLSLSGNYSNHGAYIDLPPEIFTLKNTVIDLQYQFKDNNLNEKWLRTLKPDHFSILLNNYYLEDGSFKHNYVRGHKELGAGFKIDDNLLFFAILLCPPDCEIDPSLKRDNIISLVLSEDMWVQDDSQSLPPEIAQLKNLESLELTGLISFPSEILQLKNLRSLDLRSNQLTSILPGIAQLKELKTLYLSDNKLTSLPSEIGQLKNLQVLDLHSNQELINIPFEFAYLSNLSILNLQGCSKLESKPRPMNLQSSLAVRPYQERILRKLGKKLPAFLTGSSKEIKKIISKIKIFLKKRDYNGIDQCIEMIRDLDDPEVFSTLLIGCRINNNRLVTNEIFTGPMPAQPFIHYFFWNLIGHAPSNSIIDDSIKVENITAVVFSRWTATVHSDDYYIDKFPIGLCQFHHLEELIINGEDNYQAKMDLIPPEIGQLSKLRKLEISGFRYLKSLPKEIGQLINLEHLQLSENNINSILDEIGELLKLKVLSLSESDFSDVDALANLTNLTSLDLRDCDSLQNVDGLANLTNLTSLLLRWCDKVNPKPSKDKMTTREEVAAYQEEIKKSMK
ncbi:MAG: leucine-rich repeat protein [Candidatus Marinimicrobia bacterium]|nr:leucine-rich repeat protein [Candidatus Neomarinimicrobiota bacterium]